MDLDSIPDDTLSLADLLHFGLKQRFQPGSAVPIINVLGEARETIDVIGAKSTAVQVLTIMEELGYVTRCRKDYILGH